MNLAGISTVMSVGVNHITFDIQELPNGLSYQCNNSNCEYSSGTDGCIKLSGNPTSGGTFPFDVNMTINIQIPTIPGILPSMTVDIPSFTMQLLMICLLMKLLLYKIFHLFQKFILIQQKII